MRYSFKGSPRVVLALEDRHGIGGGGATASVCGVIAGLED